MLWQNLLDTETPNVINARIPLRGYKERNMRAQDTERPGKHLRRLHS